MEVKQVYTLVNTISSEVLGKENVVNEDLSNLSDIGTSIIDNDKFKDSFVHSLIDHIGKVIFVARAYKGTAPNIMLDGWEYGSILEKISSDLPDAVENPTWDLVDGHSYDPNVFKAPKNVEAKFFNKRITFEIDESITDVQLKSAFSNAVQMNGFLSHLFVMIENAIVKANDGLITRTINTAIAYTLHADIPDADYSAQSGVKAINILKLYNAEKGTTLTADKCLTDTEFLKYASFTIGLYPDRLKKYSTLFNVGGKERFTPADLLHVVLLDNFAKSADVYLNASTFHNEMTKFPKYESVSYWQGPGKAYAFSDVSKIDVKLTDTLDVSAGGILGIMFDHDSCGVSNYDRSAKSEYITKGSFTNYFYKVFAGCFNDLNENFIVFFVA